MRAKSFKESFNKVGAKEAGHKGLLSGKDLENIFFLKTKKKKKKKRGVKTRQMSN